MVVLKIDSIQHVQPTAAFYPVQNERCYMLFRNSQKHPLNPAKPCKTHLNATDCQMSLHHAMKKCQSCLPVTLTSTCNVAKLQFLPNHCTPLLKRHYLNTFYCRCHRIRRSHSRKVSVRGPAHIAKDDEPTKPVFLHPADPKL